MSAPDVCIGAAGLGEDPRVVIDHQSSSFLVAVRRTAGVWLAVGAMVGAATWGLASVWQPLLLVYAAVLLLVGLVAMPLLFVTALSGAVAALSALLAALALPWLVCRRPTGLAATLAELWALPASIVPGYWRALRQVRQPALWGALAGFVSAVAGFVAVHGCRPMA